MATNPNLISGNNRLYRGETSGDKRRFDHHFGDRGIEIFLFYYLIHMYSAGLFNLQLYIISQPRALIKA